jgi:hypothetical protein
MQKRKLRIVKRTFPALGVCECCNTQFESNKPSGDDGVVEIAEAFDVHKCKPVDGSQTASPPEPKVS